MLRKKTVILKKVIVVALKDFVKKLKIKEINLKNFKGFISFVEDSSLKSSTIIFPFSLSPGHKTTRSIAQFVKNSLPFSFS